MTRCTVCFFLAAAIRERQGRCSKIRGVRGGARANGGRILGLWGLRTERFGIGGDPEVGGKFQGPLWKSNGGEGREELKYISG